MAWETYNPNMLRGVEQSFVVLQGDWEVAYAVDILAQTVERSDVPTPERVVIQPRADDESFQLLLSSDALTLLREQPQSIELADVFAPDMYYEVPAVTVDELAAGGTLPAIVVDSDGILGVAEPPKQSAKPPRFGGSRAARGEMGAANGGGGAEMEPAPAPNGDGEAETPVASSVVADLPGQVKQGETAHLLVSLTTETPAGPHIPFILPKDEELDIVVQAREGFEIEGESSGTLKVTAGESLPLDFKLVAGKPGRGDVRVFAFHRGQALGTIRLEPEIVAGAVQDTARLKPDSRLGVPSSRWADLSMFITEQVRDGAGEYTIYLTSTDRQYRNKEFGPVELKSDPQKYFEDFFGDIEQLRSDALEERLDAQGSHLFNELFPEDLREALWSCRDKISSIIIESEEGLIPWELCKLEGFEDGKVVAGPFLCEAYAVSRWVSGRGPAAELTANKIALVVPSDSHLPSAAEESNYIHSLGPEHIVTDVPAGYASVHTELAAGSYDVWHFTGHGVADHASPDRSVIVLEGGDCFRPVDISGVVKNLGQAKPIVFLNACQSNVGGASLTGVAGWARQFVGAGAGAFLGTFWSVDDAAAAEFCEHFYAGLLKGHDIGTAVKEARLAIKDNPGPTWLAYTVFADPLATLKQ
jgi:hypothetical protein